MPECALLIVLFCASSAVCLSGSLLHEAAHPYLQLLGYGPILPFKIRLAAIFCGLALFELFAIGLFSGLIAKACSDEFIRRLKAKPKL